MPNLTTPYPKKTGDLKTDYTNLYNWAVSLIDELKPLLNNLDCGNVIEASSVKAENINTNSAKINQAQIGELSADKLVSGTIDASKINVKNINANNITSGTLVLTDCMAISNESGTLLIDENEFSMYDTNGVERISMGQGKNGFSFQISNEDDTEGIRLTDGGNLEIKNILAIPCSDYISQDTGIVYFEPETREIIRRIFVRTNGTVEIIGGVIEGENDNILLNGRRLLTETDKSELATKTEISDIYKYVNSLHGIITE